MPRATKYLVSAGVLTAIGAIAPLWVWFQGDLLGAAIIAIPSALVLAIGLARDVSTEIAREVVQRAKAQGEELAGPVRRFVDWELEREERRSAGRLDADV